MAPRTFVSEVGYTGLDLSQELIAHRTAEEELIGVTVQKESQAGIEPRAMKQLEISKSRLKIKRWKHREGFVEFFDSPAIVEEQQAVHESSLAPRDEDIIGDDFRLEAFIRSSDAGSGKPDPLVRNAVKDDILTRAPREVVDGLEGLIRDAVEFEGGVKCNYSILAKGVRHTIAVERHSC